MQRAWAIVVLVFLLLQWQDIELFYGAVGYIPFVFLTVSLVCVCLRLQVRIALIMSVLLLLWLHTLNPLPMGGGDVLLANIGFLLMITPSLTSTTMPIWPYRLLLWQIVVIYLSSAWYKVLGDMWFDGSAVSIALQHPHFARWDLPISLIEFVSPFLTYGTLVWESLWLLLLIPFWKHHEGMKRFLLVTGVCFHLGILIFFKVGSFSFAMFVAYVGLWSASPLPLSELKLLKNAAIEEG